jgi:amidohydrolase
MSLNNRFSSLHAEIAEWRRDLHEYPELRFEVHRTAAVVAAKLREFGCDEVVTGIAQTGVVGIIKGSGNGGPVIGLRADMDALPILEATGKPYASQTPGQMHACGHDGHTAMLLGAAKYLAETRRFNGTVAVIFQPAEEGGGGAREMIKEGFLDRFGIDEVYGLHNWPGMPVGSFAICPGAIMAAADRFSITIDGKGGHAAKPHMGIDPILVGAHIVASAHSVVSRNVDPMHSAVLSFGAFNAGFTDNVIPQSAVLKGTVRTLDEGVRDLMESRLRAVVESTAAAFGAKATLDYLRDYPVTVNAADNAGYAASAAAQVVGGDAVNAKVKPSMGSEDFAYMLQERPGAYIFMGVGDVAPLHTAEYDFNDDAIPYGVNYWVALAENRFQV